MRSAISGTAAAASSLLTVTRTSCDPARASADTWAAVAAASAVSVLVMDCTTTGWEDPIRTPPTSVVTVVRRTGTESPRRKHDITSTTSRARHHEHDAGECRGRRPANPQRPAFNGQPSIYPLRCPGRIDGCCGACAYRGPAGVLNRGGRNGERRNGKGEILRMSRQLAYHAISIPAVLVAAGLMASPGPGVRSRPQRPVPADTVMPPLYESFATALFRDAAQHGSGNVFVSPVSAGVALGMAYGGARGQTREEMGRTLGFGAVVPETVAAANARLLASLRDQKDVQLLIANAMWAQQGVPLSPGYIADLRRDFGADAEAVDFGSRAAVDAINGWAARSTEGKIPTILTAPPEPRPVLMLTNAVYFKGQWAAKFDSTKTEVRGFTRPDRSVVQHRMMTQTGEYAIRVITSPERIAVLRMPYAGNRFSMYVLLPDSGAGLAGAYRALGTAPWRLAGARTKVHVVLPRFTIRTDLRLNDALKRLGMAGAFSDGADFSGMMAAGGARRRFAISDVRQATYIDVSEEGTEAAAVTSIGIQATSVHVGGVVQFVADHPFLAVLRDDQTGAILFMGQVSDP